MIDEKATFGEFGYHSYNLSPKSNKTIVCVCDDCGKVRIICKRDYRHLCLGCSMKGERSHRWKGGEVKRICQVCGKEFFIQPQNIKRGRGKFCSVECMSECFSISRKGENGSNWQGGISFEPYCPKFDFAFKEYIRDKFGRVCFLCPKTEAENGERLSVHHVNYNKDCGCDGDLTCQFVPLCRSCNSKANGNREEWTEKIMNMLRNSLKGWYI